MGVQGVEGRVSDGRGGEWCPAVTSRLWRWSEGVDGAPTSFGEWNNPGLRTFPFLSLSDSGPRFDRARHPRLLVRRADGAGPVLSPRWWGTRGSVVEGVRPREVPAGRARVRTRRTTCPG